LNDRAATITPLVIYDTSVRDTPARADCDATRAHATVGRTVPVSSELQRMRWRRPSMSTVLILHVAMAPLYSLQEYL